MAQNTEREQKLQNAREAALAQELQKQQQEHEKIVQQMQQQYADELKKQLLLPRPVAIADVAVDQKEVKTAQAIMKEFDAMYKSARKFAGLTSRDIGMLEDTDLLPDKTSDNGYAELQKNIETKTKRLEEKWKRIVTSMHKTRVVYSDIQKLRHTRLRYKKRHSKATNTKKNKKKSQGGRQKK